MKDWSCEMRFLEDEGARRADVPVDVRAWRDDGDAVGEVRVVGEQLWDCLAVDVVGGRAEMPAKEQPIIRLLRSRYSDIMAVILVLVDEVGVMGAGMRNN